LVDLDGDGHLDLLSGSWPGELFLFRGGPGRTFAAPEMLRDKNGEYINIGGGVEEQPDGTIVVTGHGEFEEDDEETVVNYHGRKIRSKPGGQIWITGTASAAHAVDWDGDGDVDLVVGDIQGKVYLVPNEGKKGAPAFGKWFQLRTALFLPVKVSGDAGPFVADWDGDGDGDLLVGSGDGSVALYRNMAARGSPPLLAAPVELVPAGEVSFDENAPAEPRRGSRAKVCAADWNGDGLLDLLLGDFATQKPALPEPSPEEKAEHDRLRKELDDVTDTYRELIEKLSGVSRVQDAAEREKLDQQLDTVQQRIGELRSKIPPEYEDHGWIWLFLRKPADG